MQDLSKINLIISGRVQGVFFRAYTKRKAEQLNISGWVKNLDDGRVEAEIIGKEDKINQMVEWFWQGSPLSKVENIDIVSKKKTRKHGIKNKFKIVGQIKQECSVF